MALAGSFHGRRRRRAHARQDAHSKPPLPAGTLQRVVDLALSAPPQIGNELTSIPERENVNSAPLDEKRTFWLFAFGCD
jgi:hypothetical protein